ncbi:MAG TPA: hypothetical protein V6D08_12155 [Candidatus Obscuribacterales bacterium]
MRRSLGAPPRHEVARRSLLTGSMQVKEVKLIALREIVWAIWSTVAMIVAERALAAERRRFRQHNDDDRKLLSQFQQSLESAGWACKARRFRDAYRFTKGLCSHGATA